MTAPRTVSVGGADVPEQAMYALFVKVTVTSGIKYIACAIR